MPRIFPVMLATLCAAALPHAIHAETSDVYADSVYDSNYDAYNPSKALGAPDGEYMDFFETDAAVTFDMGEGEEGTGDLTLTLHLFDYDSEYEIIFLNEALAELQTISDTITTSSSELTIDYTAEDPYRYVRITAEAGNWRLDAITAASVVTQEESGDEEPVNEELVEEDTTSTQGMLLKLPDDHDAATTVDAAVYMIGADGMRHAFPNEAIFYSWYEDFSSLSYIDETNMASYPLGANVAIRPGTSLIKLTNNAKVYAVESDNILHWIQTEELATTLYGTDWASRVVEIPDVFFSSYTLGDDISTVHHPSGSVGFTPEGRVIFLRNAVYYTIADDAFLRFNSDFYVAFTQAELDDYVLIGDLTEDPEIAWPF